MLYNIQHNYNQMLLILIIIYGTFREKQIFNSSNINNLSKSLQLIIGKIINYLYILNKASVYICFFLYITHLFYKIFCLSGRINYYKIVIISLSCINF